MFVFTTKRVVLAAAVTGLIVGLLITASRRAGDSESDRQAKAQESLQSLRDLLQKEHPVLLKSQAFAWTETLAARGFVVQNPKAEPASEGQEATIGWDCDDGKASVNFDVFPDGETESIFVFVPQEAGADIARPEFVTPLEEIIGEIVDEKTRHHVVTWLRGTVFAPRPKLAITKPPGRQELAWSGYEWSIEFDPTKPSQFLHITPLKANERRHRTLTEALR